MRPRLLGGAGVSFICVLPPLLIDDGGYRRWAEVLARRGPAVNMFRKHFGNDDRPKLPMRIPFPVLIGAV